MVSESFVRRYWPNADPIGKTFEIRAQNRTVVGVVGDIKVRGLERTNEPQVYIPAKQPPDEGLGDLYVPKDLVIRSPRQRARAPPGRSRDRPSGGSASSRCPTCG